jgi:hypothetical protein
MAITKALLIHWWRHYAKLLFLPEDLEKFHELIDKFGEQKVLDFITNSYKFSKGSDYSPSILLTSIRHGVAETLLSALPDTAKMPPIEKASWDKTQHFLLEQFSKSYKHAA